MPITSKNPQYEAAIDKWVRSRDAYTGGDAIKAGGELYLPRIPGQTGDEYAAYACRPTFYEIIGRTVDGLIGAVTRLPHSFDLPTEIVPMLSEASKDGLTLDEVIKGLLAECLLQGRVGVLVDIDTEIQMPYLTQYSTECITNWGSDWVVLHESVLEPAVDDPFKFVAIDQYRQLHIVDGAYTVTIWRKGASDTWYVHSEVVPTRRGRPLDFIPFSFVTPSGCTRRVQRPPLLGVVDLALQHYRVSADLFQALFFCAIPTLYVAGISNDVPIRVGGASAILLPDSNAKVGYVEFTGSGVGSIREALQDIERRAGSLGASILLAEKERGNETASAANIRSSNQTALLSATVYGVQDALIRSLKIAAFWAGAPDNAVLEVKLNAEFIPARVDAAMVSSLVQAVQSGALSIPAFQAALADGGVIEQPAT